MGKKHCLELQELWVWVCLPSQSLSFSGAMTLCVSLLLPLLELTLALFSVLLTGTLLIRMPEGLASPARDNI